MTSRAARIVGIVASLAALMLVNPAVAQAATASKVTPSLTFSGTGTSQTIVTKVGFTSTYNGAYYVKYDIYRGTSSAKANAVKMTTTTISQTFSTTTSGKTYTTTTTSKSCAPNSTKTTYYYWLVGSVSDGGTGVVTINSAAVAKVACTAVY